MELRPPVRALGDRKRERERWVEVLAGGSQCRPLSGSCCGPVLDVHVPSGLETGCSVAAQCILSEKDRFGVLTRLLRGTANVGRVRTAS